MILDPTSPVGDDEEYEDDEEFWEDEAPLDTTNAFASAPDGPTMLADLLLELSSAMMKLRVLLTEAEEAEFMAVVPRYAALLEEVDKLPTEPTRRRKIGFKVEKTEAPVAKKKKPVKKPVKGPYRRK